MSEKFEFIDAECAMFTSNSEDVVPVAKMCDWLGVSRSGFYEWRSRPLSVTARRREDLKLLIAKSFEDSDGTATGGCTPTCPHGVSPVDPSSCVTSCGNWTSRRASRDRGATASQRTTAPPARSPTS